MASPVSTSNYTNPYSGILSTSRNDGPAALMKRFARDVRLPDPRELRRFDLTEPVRRFARDVQPPRYTPLNPATGKEMTSSYAEHWNIDNRSAAVKAYRSAGSAPPGWSSINRLS